MKKAIFGVLLLGLVACHDKDNDGGLPKVETPENVTCVTYPDGAHTLHIDTRIAEDPEFRCLARLCEVCGECFYGCPDDMLDEGCR